MLLTVTGTPTNVLRLRNGEYTVELFWSSPASSTPLVAGYEVFYAESGSDVTHSAGTTIDTTINVTTPAPDVAYDFFVVAFSDADNSLPSALSSFAHVIDLSIHTCRCNHCILGKVSH